MTDHKTISTPILDFVQQYAASGISRFHMPGHKGSEVLPQLSFQADITEISGAGFLYEPEGIISESERHASELFGSGATFYSTEGSSLCIRAMLALVTHSVPVVLAARNVHRSFLTAAALLDLDVEWLFDRPTNSINSICTCPVAAPQVRRKLEEMAEKDRLPAAVYLTSPDYLGYMQDISSIAETVHSFDIPLLVDNAHGAYLHFLEKPLHPMDLGADLCCDSAHKTLPALTGCAYLHISKKAAPLYAAHAKNALSLFGSTSPSWLLLQSLDQTNVILSGDFREKLKSCISSVVELKNRLQTGSALSGSNSLQHASWEPLKITLNAAAAGMSGMALADQLRIHRIECEYADPDHVVLMVSPYNSATDFSRLKEALDDIRPEAARATAASEESLILESSIAKGSPDLVMNKVPIKAMSIRQAAMRPSRMLPVDQAIGHVCADLSLSCPPGIPVVVCGEIITEQAAAILRHYHISKILTVA